MCFSLKVREKVSGRKKKKKESPAVKESTFYMGNQDIHINSSRRATQNWLAKGLKNIDTSGAWARP